MPRNFTNPPLQEAVCEFRFKSDNWDPSIAGLLYPELGKVFPKKESVQEGQIEFFLGAGRKQTPKISHSENELPKFSTEDGNIFVIFRKNIVSVHCTNPYPGWEDFYSKVKLVEEKYREAAKPDDIERVGLRYINKISLPKKDFLFSDYFKINLSPLENTIKNEDIIGFQIGIVSQYESGQVKTQFANLGENGEKVEFILDIDCFINKTEKIADWLETAHSKVEEIFLGSLEQKTIKTFE